MAINLTKIGAGSLRDSISFVEEKITTNDKGFKVKNLDTSFFCRCKAEHINTREIYRMGQLNLDISFKFTIRKQLGNKIKKGHKIKFKDVLYTITYQEELFNNRNYLVLYCSEFKGK